MELSSFWIKVAIKRILGLSKPYFLVIICASIFIGAFLYAFINGYIAIKLDLKTIYLIVLLIVFLTLFISFKNYNLMPILLKYSKSKYTNRIIFMRYFIKEALVNNLLLIVFYIIASYSIIKYQINKTHIFILLVMTIISMLLSFIIMSVKYKFMNNKNTEINNTKLKLNPLIKSALYDYLSSDFLISFILCTFIFMAIIFNVARDINQIHELKNNTNFFIMITIVFSVGFTGIIGSILNINWKFQAINSPNSIKYHLKRTFLVVFGFFGWLILLFIIFGSFINITLTVKYLYCIFVVLFTIVNISFSITNVMIKMFIITIITVLTAWVSTLPIGFLAILAVPVILTFLKAKNEYIEWSLL
jgi:hypothetical protein